MSLMSDQLVTKEQTLGTLGWHHIRHHIISVLANPLAYRQEPDSSRAFFTGHINYL